MKHLNNGNCPQCELILNRYSGIYQPLYTWFKTLQKIYPSAHVSCAGRGQLDQEACFIRGASKARYGESAHNANAALDLFELDGDKANIYEKEWFNKVLVPNIPDWLRWFGVKNAKFYELPHVEVLNWRFMLSKGQLKLVEPIRDGAQVAG